MSQITEEVLKQKELLVSELRYNAVFSVFVEMGWFFHSRSHS